MNEQLLVRIFILFNIAYILNSPSPGLKKPEDLQALFAKERDVRILIDIDRS